MSNRTRIPLEEESSSSGDDSYESSSDEGTPEETEAGTSSQNNQQEAEDTPLPPSTNSSLINALQQAQITDDTCNSDNMTPRAPASATPPRNQDEDGDEEMAETTNPGKQAKFTPPDKYYGERNKFKDFNELKRN